VAEGTDEPPGAGAEAVPDDGAGAVVEVEVGSAAPALGVAPPAADLPQAVSDEAQSNVAAIASAPRRCRDRATRALWSRGQPHRLWLRVQPPPF
jgi:hypothetical protein